MIVHSDNEQRDANSGQTWRELYEAAILELDPQRLHERIEDAQAAIADRVMVVLATDDCDQNEEKTLATAHLVLEELKRLYEPDFHNPLRPFEGRAA